MKAPLLALLLLAPHATPAEDEPTACESTSFLEAYGLGSAWDDLARMAQDVGAAPLRADFLRRPADRSTPLCDSGPALPLGRRSSAPATEGVLTFVPVTVSAYGNSTYPRDANDGALWQGRGVSSQLAAGVALRWGILSAAVAPSVAFQQNAPFDLVPNGQTGDLAFMDPWHGTAIDLPQRFGDGAFWTVSPGQSYLRADYAGFAAGISTENMWWGPGMRNSILMSNTASGFPHAFLGTGRPVDVGIGKVEAQVHGGRLSRSRYFPDQGHPWLFAAVLDYEPRWVPGLYLGAAGVNIRSCACIDDPLDTNSLVGLYGRWVFPAVGLEVYGEWAREDSAKLADFLRQPDHSAGYTLGLQKVWVRSGAWVRLRAEMTDIQPLRPQEAWGPGPVVFYVHPGNFSYTNAGQLLGAAIGPGGSSQHIGVDVLTASGWWGGYFERVRRHEDVYLFQLGGPWGGNDVEMTLGFRYVRSFGPVDLTVDLAASHRYNWNFIRSDGNAHLMVELTLWPGRVR